jgi:hypothetical protein
MRKRVYAFLLIAAASTVLVVSAQTAGKSLTGTWRTEAPAHYLVEQTPEHPHGEPVPHEGMEIVARSASLEWTLTERPHGLITGTNQWVAYDEDGKKVFEGSEPLLGARDGDSSVLTEPHDEGGKTARIVFQITRESKNRIRGLAYSVSGPKLLAMRFVLVRKR